MKNEVWQKDMAVIGEFAGKLGVPTPLFHATLPVYAAAMSAGHAEQDTAAVCARAGKDGGREANALSGIKRVQKIERRGFCQHRVRGMEWRCANARAPPSVRRSACK